MPKGHYCSVYTLSLNSSGINNWIHGRDDISKDCDLQWTELVVHAVLTFGPTDVKF